MSDQRRLEEQALSEVVKQGLFTQIDNAEDLNVDIKTDLLKAVQGKVDSVTIAGQGIVIQEEIRVEELEIQTDQISIHPLSALFGEIKLDQPVNTTAKVVLTESDLNQAINSDFVKNLIPTFELNVEGQVVTLEVQFPLEIRLPSDEKIHAGGHLKLHKSDGVQDLSFAAVVLPRTATHPILFESFYCAPGQGQSIEFLIALLKRMRELTSPPYFELEETSYHIQSMEVTKEHLSLEVELQARQIPSIPD